MPSGGKRPGAGRPKKSDGRRSKRTIIAMSEMDVPDAVQVVSVAYCPCGRPFIPNTAKRRLCFVCSKFRRRKA